MHQGLGMVVHTFNLTTQEQRQGMLYELTASIKFQATARAI